MTPEQKTAGQIVKTMEYQLHPELREDEIFLMNIYDDTDGRTFAGITGYKTKRKGTVAYHENGKPFSSTERVVPVFVQKSEFEARLAHLLTFFNLPLIF